MQDTLLLILKAAIIGAVVVTVSELARDRGRIAALVLSLPLTTIVAFLVTWWTLDPAIVMPKLATLSRETIIFVLLGLPFFLPFIFSKRIGLSFWPAMGTGIVLASMTISMWFWLGPRFLTWLQACITISHEV